VLDLVLLRRAREHDRPPALLQLGDQLARPLEDHDLVDQLGEQLALGGADPVAGLLLDLLAGDRADELVAPHPDVAVDPPHRRHHSVAAERAVPRDRVVVVRVDERPVDVEDRSGRHRGHPRGPRGDCHM
jgi:hypothetical protein